MQVIKFQKHGWPHTHLLLIVNRDNKLRTVDDINKTVCAEILADEELQCIMLHCMVHRCNSTRQKDGKCTKHFPKPFAEYTSWEDNETILKYRRRTPDTGGRQEVVHGQTVDNRCIVPYNPYLSKKYRCHINVEACSSVKASKYLFKYIYKGNDRAMVHNAPANQVPPEAHNEISEYQNL